MNKRWHRQLPSVTVLVWALLCIACAGSHPAHDVDAGAVLDGGAAAADGGATADGGPTIDGGGTDGGDPAVFDAIPNPALVVAVGGAAAIAIVDPTTGSVVSTRSVASALRPHHISVSADKTRVLVTATSADLSQGHGGGHGGHGAAGSSAVYNIDVASKRLTRAINVAATAHNAAFTSDGRTIVLSMMEHGMIAGYNASTYREAFTTAGLNMPLEVTVTHSNTLLIAESGANTLAHYDLASRRVTERFDVGATPVAAWTSTLRQYFVSVEGGKRVRHITEGSLGVVLDTHSIDPGGVPGQAVLARSGLELWVAVEDRAVIAIFDFLNHTKLAEIPCGTRPHGIAVDDTGMRAFVTDEGGTGVFVIDVERRAISREIRVGAQPNGIVFLQR